MHAREHHQHPFMRRLLIILIPACVLGSVLFFFVLQKTTTSSSAPQQQQQQQQLQGEFSDQQRDVVSQHAHSVASDGKICVGWCAPKVNEMDRLVRSIDCSARSLQDHVKAALQLENCASALQSKANAQLVREKIDRLATNDAFVFFRGAAGFFDLDLMCNDPNFQVKKKLLPRVTSNGDAHPENFGTQVMVNGKLVWGVNDFDQSFATPFSWDLKRGATGTEVACRTKGYNEVVCRASVDAFVGSYLNVVSLNVTQLKKITNDFRFVEGSRASMQDPILVDIFKRARRSESDEEILKWLHDDLNVDTEKDRFFQTERTQPLPDSMIPAFQAAVDAYLYHGVPALMLYPPGEFWKVLSVAQRFGSGTGSIGLNRFFILLRGKKSSYGGRIVLEMKQEIHSLLEMFFRYKYSAVEQGKRAVDAERGAYPYTNPFYGWTTYNGHAYIIRERSKHEKTVRLDDLSAEGYLDYSVLCGKALAMYHFRMQCATAECALNDPIGVDHEVYQSVRDYIYEYGKEDFRAMVSWFAHKETERQISAWEYLTTVVRQMHDRNEDIIDLLNFKPEGYTEACS